MGSWMDGIDEFLDDSRYPSLIVHQSPFLYQTDRKKFEQNGITRPIIFFLDERVGTFVHTVCMIRVGAGKVGKERIRRTKEGGYGDSSE